MDRRLAGLAVLVLVVVAATVVPGLSGRRVAGSAVPKSFPDPPAIGDCAVSVPTREGGNFGEPFDLDVTAVGWGPCSGPIAGEVVAVQLSDNTTVSPGDDWPDTCFRGASAFAGLDVSGPYPTLAGAPSTDPVTWAPAVAANIQRVHPDDEERRAGRSWLACLVTPAIRGSYRGTLEQAFVSGQLPEEFGVCWNGADLEQSGDLIPCGEPHSAQLLAIGDASDRSLVSLDELQSACRAVATLVMRTDRPVEVGELATVIDVADDGASADAPLTAGCFATAAGSRQLGGSLIGLDDRPVPFAS